MQVLDPRAAPAIDRLIVITDHECKTRLTDEQPEPFVLDRVGVLELVHQNVAKARAIVLEERGIVLPQLVGAQQQLGEIHDTAASAGLLIGLINLDELAARRIAIILQVLCPQALVFLRVDEP